MANSYQVFVDDNYHYQDETGHYKLGDFAAFDEALNACKNIVDNYLLQRFGKDISADRLYENYVEFGEDPFIVGEAMPFRFSAWDYAKERCRQICGEN